MRHPLCLLVFLALAAFSGPARARQEPPPEALEENNVLILHAHEANAPLFLRVDEGISKALDHGGVPKQNQHYVSLDLRRNPGPEYRSLRVDEMRLRFSHRKVAAIVTMFPEALEFLLKDARDLFPDVPVLALYLPEGFQLPKADRPITGHSAVPDIIGTVEIALRLFPASNRIYVVSGTHEVDRRMEEQARSDLKQWEGRLEAHSLSQRSLEEILSELSSALAGTLVLLLPFTRDTAGRLYHTANLTERLSKASAAPIFGVLETGLGSGAIGGNVLDFGATGEQAGEWLLDVLGGRPKPGDSHEFLVSPSVPMFDWRQLRRWKLSESDLPEGSVVLNKEFRLWDLRNYAIGALAFILLQSFLIARLLVQRRRKESAQESLRQRTEELDQFFNVTLDLLCIADKEGYFLRLNPAWERTLGYGRGELMANRFLDFVHPDDLDRTQEALSRLAEQHRLTSFSNRYRCRDGSYRWLEWTAAPVGERIYAAARDITERQFAEAEAMQRRAELAHLSRVATIGELTTSLAHEINQPLTAILSNAQAAQRFLCRPAPDISEVRQILDDIIRDNRRASEVLRNVRALVRKEEPRREWLDLNEAIREVALLLRGEALLQGFSVTMELSPALKRVQGDYSQLQQVILNLILNGAAAMGNAPREQRRIVVRTAMADNGWVRVSVKDLGTGIDENRVGRLFEPFYSTKPDGMGMGLSISQRIIRDHGGTMEASNNPEGGATFAFWLPAPQGDAS
jgi:PAS domain S-box-containing protein